MSLPVVGFLGAGNMGSALIEGALRSGSLDASCTLVYDLDSARINALCNKFGVQAQKSASDCAAASDFLFLCVKPQQMQSVLKEIGPVLNKKTCLISIAAGIPLKLLQAWLPPQTPVVRVMPNTPALVGYGISGVCIGSSASLAHRDFALNFFCSVGQSLLIPEEYFDALTAVSGSGPAYVFYLAQNLIEAAKQMGLKDVAAQSLVKQTVLGAAQMLQGDDDAQTLRKKVTSPGGTTQAAITHLEQSAWGQTFVQAVVKARDRGTELSKEYS